MKQDWVMKVISSLCLIFGYQSFKAFFFFFFDKDGRKTIIEDAMEVLIRKGSRRDMLPLIKINK